ncbi:MAG TPA: YgjP-like metallopeptidase domain-containing protein [Candidatus Saccharimonadales bacterium]|nr:YgjP-like metallopeptidase domain-containing protein [Candidatus Saccharimonadales bacterium]
MPVKKLHISEVGDVNFYKRKGVRSIKLSITSDNTVRVSMPYWTPYKAAAIFVEKNRDWIMKHRKDPGRILNGSPVGKSHTLVISNSAKLSKPYSKVTSDQLILRLPLDQLPESELAQAAARKLAYKGLLQQSKLLLKPRLDELAIKYSFSYRNLKIRQLKSRWGSCNRFGDITLNYFLVQLPWEQIDYVILHELTHTKVLSHGPKFWNALERVSPNAKTLRKQLHAHQPVLKLIPLMPENSTLF